MYAVERRHWIVRHSRAAGRVEVAGVCEELGVAPETVRRDLTALERQGLVRRVHGGAIPVERLGFEGELERRADARRDEKARIASAALVMLENAESVFLDEGSTVQALAEQLHPERPLTVVTAALPTACLLAQRPNVTVLALGGRVRGHTLGVVDHWAVGMLADLVLDLAVTGTNGISLEHGLTCPDTTVAAVKSAGIAASRRTILLTDHTKFGVDSFCRFAGLRDLEAVVSDRAAPERYVRQLRSQGVEVVQA
ncbi:MAG: DeoR/GlpR transcriptional regulator [Euzebyales bacterium]|nr:DeoR/GlpR transcriptional regulator [Euzebyales bacterium]